MNTRSTLAAFVLAVALSAPTSARASDPAAAQALFDDGVKLMESKQYAPACAKLEESQRLDPAIGTAFNLADCYQQLGRTASAWTAFTGAADAAAAAHQPVREKAARTRANALLPKLTRMTIAVARDVEGLEVTRNGTAVGKAQWSSAVPIDPGTYTVRATAPGKTPWEALVPAQGEGASVTVNVPPLDDAPAVVTTPPLAAPPVAPGASTTPAVESYEAAPPRSAWNTQKTLALVTGSVGVGAIVVGVYFGVRSRAKHDDAKAGCDDQTCNAAGYAANQDAIAFGTYANISYGVALAGAIGAVVLMVTAPSGAPPSAAPATARLRFAPIAAPGAAGFGAAGSW